jgi:hypothetical protein
MTLSVDGVDVGHRFVAYKGDDADRGAELRVRDRLHERVVDLKCDLVSRYVVRLLDHLQEHGYDAVTPVDPPEPSACRC